jgi:hypothetical protein
MKQALWIALVIGLWACTAEEPAGNDLRGGSGLGGSVAGSGGLGGAGAGGAGGAVPPSGGVGGGVPLAGSGGGESGAPTAGTGSAGMDAAGTGGVAGSAMAGTGGVAGSMGMAGASGAGGTAAGTVTVTFTTVSYGGEYAPGNYGALWFEKADGTFIKTAKRWAGAAHATDLVGWTMASGGWGSIFFPTNMADQMDAVSSATIRAHQMHSVTWNMMDATPALVPDGELVAVLEMSESRARDRNGPLLKIPFTKGASPAMAMPPDQEGFSGVSLSYQP